MEQLRVGLAVASIIAVVLIFAAVLIVSGRIVYLL
jgi:hypothetical protein